jgi:hypothetical protein
MADVNAIYEHNESLVTRDLAGEKIIVPVRGKVGDLGSIYTLNSVANEIWVKLDGQRTVEAIVDELHREYEVDRQTLANDISRVLDELSMEGLIRSKIG